MGETSNQIERHIRETRNDLGDNFSELEEKVKSATDWRVQFQERPMTMIAVAFGGGVLLSALLPAPGPSRRRYSEHRSATSPDREAASTFKSAGEPDGKPSQALEAVNAVKNALVGVAVTKLSGFIEDVFPGFKQEFGKTPAGKRLDQGSSTSGQPTWQKSSAAGAD
jgi:hypothetical protein